MLATQYAEYYKIEPQREGEGDYDFRYRVARMLREQGRLIEAHEAFQDKYYDHGYYPRVHTCPYCGETSNASVCPRRSCLEAAFQNRTQAPGPTLRR